MKRNWKRKIPFIILAVLAGIFVFTGIVMLLWNGILPAVLHVSSISFWQAMGILLLAKILFGGFRGRRHFGGGWRWRKQMYRRWQNMTDEEKAKWSEQMQCCGRNWHATDDVKPAV